MQGLRVNEINWYGSLRTQRKSCKAMYRTEDEQYKTSSTDHISGVE